jgi:hypothetical protein
MTIIADRQSYAAPPQGPVRSSAGGQSFAARIEAGERAKDIVQDRALGFSEAGLLGLHYAHDSSSNAAAQAGRNYRTDFTPEANITIDERLIDKSVVISDSQTLSINILPSGGQTSGNVDAARSNRFLRNPATSLPSLEVMVVGNDETANELPSPVSKLFQKAISQSRPGIKFGLKIIETPHGISVICEESSVSEIEFQELTDLAQQIAKDFGVTIQRLVVNGKSSV